MFSQYNIWLSVFVAMHRTLIFLLSVSGNKSEYIGLGPPTYILNSEFSLLTGRFLWLGHLP